MSDLVRLSSELRESTKRLRFAAPVHHVYNPLIYAWAPHVAYLERYGKGPKEALLLGMKIFRLAVACYQKQHEIGFRTSVELRDGLAHTVEWTRANLDRIDACIERHQRHMT